ncbi:tRNA (adenosine(37)-N6)-threonylcarbamoyltransferase complex dimerization subunit type 1 TsaB [Paracoccus sp. SCSIO 75233]|uniref:tRNA (adenosine(37)-N6)-threonylcarbamoyltransferase complex dimerization subunit type 1 TsaB n=1 Tax=Paracoccus sp. SCSIO 75233 TaxID=3017782 RepID=UPI0022F06CF2|nr:tRNA (adenosine(37)-N6)-threonylcarbamoyltransferase complex dimerization subunit type 1 TsaB [Paracoccus sp. SCSIO 75233]WBU53397.1 tRNA (adenosine(37)-N6)-threonylcarbamoyltransferase complex dimerization subunit type 1 TsaB [Paracoccus sp. SCSIO 75233]
MPDALTLGFDTSAAHCAAALLSGDRVIATRLEQMSKGQAERLFPLLEELLASANAQWRDLSLIGVGTGPGNFTGIRISVAAARGLALSLGIPAIGVSATEALAFGLSRPCRIVIPGRRDQAIWQDFGVGPSSPQQGEITSLPPGPPVADPIVTIAEGTARIAREQADEPQPRPAPLYLRPADAAPSRERGPVMLP